MVSFACVEFCQWFVVGYSSAIWIVVDFYDFKKLLSASMRISHFRWISRERITLNWKRKNVFEKPKPSSIFKWNVHIIFEEFISWKSDQNYSICKQLHSSVTWRVCCSMYNVYFQQNLLSACKKFIYALCCCINTDFPNTVEQQSCE